MINVATTMLLFMSLVSARQHTAHQHSLRARGCETEQAFSRDGTIRSPGGLPEKVKACMSSNGEITQVTFQNKDGSDIRTLRVSDKRKKVWKNLFDSAKEAKEKVGSDETKTPPDCTFFV